MITKFFFISKNTYAILKWIILNSNNYTSKYTNTHLIFTFFFKYAQCPSFWWSIYIIYVWPLTQLERRNSFSDCLFIAIKSISLNSEIEMYEMNKKSLIKQLIELLYLLDCYSCLKTMNFQCSTKNLNIDELLNSFDGQNRYTSHSIGHLRVQCWVMGKLLSIEKLA